MLKNIIYYFLKESGELPNARITKLVYLLDWEYSLKHGKQITDIEWYFDYYGPFVRDIESIISNDSEIFTERVYHNVLGNASKFFSIKGKMENRLDDKIISIMKNILLDTKDLSFNEFIKYVYSTYPIYKTRQFNKLDLVKLAKEFNYLKK